MTDVTYNFAANANILAAEVNQNFDDVVALATSVGNEQLSGGITVDKLSDGYAVSWDSVQLVPYSAAHTAVALQSPEMYTIPTSFIALDKWQPILKNGVEGFLCAIVIYVRDITISTATYPAVKFLLNGSTTLGGQFATLDVDDEFTYIAANDPIANPLCALSDGDYIEIQMGPSTGSAAAEIRGCRAMFITKYKLVS